MKMVSQLTRQAMSRHRLISSASFPSSPPSAPSLKDLSVRSLYALPDPLPAQAAGPSAPSIALPPSPPPASLQSRQTIYSQLMKKHDRFTERHIHCT